MSYCVLFFISCLLINGCATTPLVKPTIPLDIPGVYHRIEKGQTLWRISKIYNIDLDEIVKINHLPDATRIERGQLLFIPHRQKQAYLPSKTLIEDFIWPAKGKVIVNFGQNFNNMINKGINIQYYSNSNVVASSNGKVVFYDDNFADFGKTIIIEHKDGFSTIYSGNFEVFIKTGDYVQKGDLIAKAGFNDPRDKNVYLHFEIRKGYISKNPYFYLP